MQIKLDNVKFRNLDLDFIINDKKMTGIVSSDIYDLITTNYIICNNICDEGKIKYSKKYNKNKIGLISVSDLSDTFNINAYDFLEIKNPDEELLKLLEVKENLFNRKMDELSTTQKIKILLLKCLIKNPDIIFVDSILERLDTVNRKKILKLLWNLKKFKEKTIVISTIDIDLIYEFIDDIVIIENGKAIGYGNKYDIYSNCNINKPFVIKVKDSIYKKSKINIGNNDNINELIKAIYREIR